MAQAQPTISPECKKLVSNRTARLYKDSDIWKQLRRSPVRDLWGAVKRLCRQSWVKLRCACEPEAQAGEELEDNKSG